MTDQFLKPKPIPYGKSQNTRRRNLILLGTAVLLVITLSWLLIRKFSANPFDKIDSLLSKKQISRAAMLNYELLEKYPQNRLAILMNGSVINFAIRELNITDTKLPFYEYEDFLEKEDRSGVFIRQGFLKKYSLFPDSAYFLNDFCAYSSLFPESLENPEVMMVIQRSLKSETRWNVPDSGCVEKLFTLLTGYRDIRGVISGDNLSLREKPDKKSRVITKLKKGTVVLVKNTGFDDTIGNKTAKWLYVFTETSSYGWVFGGYVEMQ